MLYDLVIVGAGSAGLSAARAAKAAGLSVRLLEAGPRIGGRAHTAELAGQPWDTGAHWLHQATTNPMREWADKLGFHYRRGDRPRFLFWNRDHWADREEEDALRAYYDQQFDAALELGKTAGDVPAAGAMDPGHPWRPLLDYWYHAVNGADPKDASALEPHLYAPGEGDWPVVEGYGRLLAEVFADHDAVLNCRVRAIDWSSRQVKVTTDGGLLEARSVIVTVSSAVLASEAIAFNPALPPEKEAALAGLSIAQVNKVAVAFSESPFGLEEPANFHALLEDGRCLGGQLQPFDRPLAIVYLAGKPATELEKDGPAAMTDFVLEEMTKAWGSTFKRRVIATDSTAWCHDPCFGGGYSLARPGQTHQRDILAQPLLGRLFFAGEATIATHAGTVHGAYLSGIRAAAEAAQALSS